MSPARPIDVNLNQAPTNINPHRITESDRAAIAGVDQNKLNEMAAKMVAVDKMNPAFFNFFKLAGGKLDLMCSRGFEKDIKALPSQADDPNKYKAEWFEARDTSQGYTAQDYHNNGLIINDPDAAYRAGYLKKNEAQALKFFANTHSNPEQRNDHLFIQNPNTGQGERGFQQGGGQQQQENPDEQEQGSSDRQAIAGPPASAPARSNSPSQSQPPNLVAGDEAVMNSMFPPGDPYADFLRGLFPQENQSRVIFLDVMKRVQNRRDLKQKILSELNKLDPSKPQDAAKLWKLQNEMQTINMDDQMDLDGLGQVRAEANKMKDFERSIIEALMQDRKTLAQNIGVK